MFRCIFVLLHVYIAFVAVTSGHCLFHPIFVSRKKEKNPDTILDSIPIYIFFILEVKLRQWTHKHFLILNDSVMVMYTVSAAVERLTRCVRKQYGTFFYLMKRHQSKSKQFPFGSTLFWSSINCKLNILLTALNIFVLAFGLSSAGSSACRCENWRVW